MSWICSGFVAKFSVVGLCFLLFCGLCYSFLKKGCVQLLVCFLLRFQVCLFLVRFLARYWSGSWSKVICLLVRLLFFLLISCFAIFGDVLVKCELPALFHYVNLPSAAFAYYPCGLCSCAFSCGGWKICDCIFCWALPFKGEVVV